MKLLEGLSFGTSYRWLDFGSDLYADVRGF